MNFRSLSYNHDEKQWEARTPGCGCCGHTYYYPQKPEEGQDKINKTDLEEQIRWCEEMIESCRELLNAIN